MLRRLNIYSLMDNLFVAARCKVSTHKAKEVIKTLADGGYIEFDHEAENCLTATGPAWKKPRYREVDYYKLTDKGIELRNASAATKMPRTKANQIIVALLKRVEEANAMDFAYRIPTVIVYEATFEVNHSSVMWTSPWDLKGNGTRMRSATPREGTDQNLHSPADVHFPTL